MVIFDFDDTLFDTHGFKQARSAALQKIGISPAKYAESYQVAYIENSIYTYSNERHAEILAQDGFDEDQVVQTLAAMTAVAKNFLFPEAVPFLQTLKARGETLILLSLGDPWFQGEKVTECGIGELFDQTYITSDTKEQVLREILAETTEKEIWFINDKIEETERLQSEFSEIRALLKVSPAIPLPQYQASNLLFFNSLSEIQTYVCK